MENEELKIGQVLDLPEGIIESIKAARELKNKAWQAMNAFAEDYEKRSKELWSIIKESIPETENFNLVLRGDGSEKEPFKLILMSKLDKFL